MQLLGRLQVFRKGPLIFGRSALIGALFVIVIASLCSLGFCLRGAVDREGFQELMLSFDPSQATKEPHTSHHLRKEVVKEVILANEPLKRRARLYGDQAVMVLDRDQKRTDILEHLHGVTAIIQEKLVTDGGVSEQVVLKLQAERLLCDYHRDEFVANGATVQRVLVAGHQMQSDVEGGRALVWGKAPIAKLKLQSNTLTLLGGVEIENHQGNASAEKATLFPQKIILEDAVTFKDRLGEVHANRCVIDFEGEQQVMRHIHLEGDIRILNCLKLNPLDESSKQYALAERVDYYPETGEMLLYAADDARVLFYDQDEEFEVSAPALKIQRNKKPLKHAVFGLGDVRFHFADDEKEQLKKRFNVR